MAPAGVRTTPSLGANFAPTGVSGLKHWGGYLNEEFLPELRGDQWLRTIPQMLTRDPVIGGIDWGIQSLVRGVTWTINPADNSQEAAKVREQVEGVLFEDMSPNWQVTVSEHLSMAWFGWDWCEVIWKPRHGYQRDPELSSKFDDGLIGIRSIAGRAQETRYKWEFGEAGEILGMWQIDPNNLAAITLLPREKCLHFRVMARKGNPEGYSFLRNSYEPWYYKRRIQAIEATGIARDLCGMPVAWVPPELFNPDASATDKTIFSRIQTLITSIHRDEQEGVVWPLAYDEKGNKTYDLTLLSTGGRRQFDLDAVINRYNAAIATPMLADFILIGHEKVGSFALANAKIDLFAVGLGAVLESIASVYNVDLIPRWCRINGIAQELAPTMAPGAIDRTDLIELSTYIKNLVDSGMPLWPNAEAQQHLLDLADIPVPDTTDEPLPTEAPPPDVPTEDVSPADQVPETLPATTPATPAGMPRAASERRRWWGFASWRKAA
jgi:hypothetical protein